MLEKLPQKHFQYWLWLRSQIPHSLTSLDNVTESTQPPKLLQK